jgi:hypothetical protein
VKSGNRWVAGFAAVAALIGLAWWLLGPQQDDAGSAGPRAAPTSDAVAQRLTDAAARLAAVTDELAPKTLEIAAASADVMPAVPGKPVTFTGRVLDEAGRPVQDAEVVHLPSYPMREAAGLDDASNGWTPPWSRFARARTDALGRFTLPSRELPVHRVPLLDVDAGGSYRGSMDGSVPRLLVQHPAFEPKLFLDFAFARGESAAGDLVVSPCGVVVGRCVDAQGQPVAGVPIRLGRMTKSGMDMGVWAMLYMLPQTESGADGRFSFGGLWNRELSIEFEAPDFVLQRKDVTVVAAQSVDLGDVVLERGGEVTGWVASADGAPIAGARVALKPNIMDGPDTGADAALVDDQSKSFMGGSFTELYTTTGADGAFRFAGVATLQNRAWRAVAAADGYEAQLVPKLAPGEPPLHFTLQPSGSLLLRVVEPGSATPVQGVKLQAHRIAVSDRGDDGKSSLPMIATHEGEAWRLLGAGASNDVLVSAPGHATTGFVLPAVPLGGMVEHSVELPPEAVLAGHIVDESGAPVPRATLRVQPPEDVPVKLAARTARTDEQGAFRLDALGAGEWTLVPAADGFIVAEAVVRGVKAGERVEDLELKLARGGSIAGRILAADPRSVVGTQVRAEPVTALAPEVLRGVAATTLGGWKPKGESEVQGVKFKAVADDRGDYALRGLPAGTYRVGTWFGAPVEVEVRIGETTPLDISLRQPPRLHGRVTLAGAPVEGAQVVVGEFFKPLKFWDEIKDTTTDAGGRYELVLGGEGEGYGNEIFARFKDWKTRSLKIQPRIDQDLAVDLAFPGGAMVGEIVDDLGQPVMTQVQWNCASREGFTQGDEVDVSGDSDASGHFRLEHLPDGAGPLMVSKGSFIGVTQDVVVKDGGTTIVPRIVLRRGCELEVRVGGSSDPQDPMKRYLVRVSSVADPTWPGTELHARFGQSTRFRGIPPGAIRIEVLKPVSAWDFEPLRTVEASVQLDSVTRFDQPVDA